MNLELKSGKYVVAVSGGVDSVVLLEVLSKQLGVDLVVAHFDHGIRPDSAKDRQFVESLADQYQLPFEYAEGRLEPKASEAIAREARYEFLHQVRDKHTASAIITAHHQDDLLETTILNWLRGTGRLGLSSLRSTDDIKRPLLNFTKAELLAYAKAHKLEWHEDSTNVDEKYLRNYVRRQIIPKFSVADRDNLLDIIKQATSSNQKINNELNQVVSLQSSKQLNRQWFINLPHSVAKEIMANWLRRNNIELNRQLIERLVANAKTYQAGKYASVDKDHTLKISRKHLALEPHER